MKKKLALHRETIGRLSALGLGKAWGATTFLCTVGETGQCFTRLHDASACDPCQDI